MEENQESAAEQQKGSNPSLVIGIIVIIVVVAGVFWVMSSNKNQAAQTTQTKQTQTQATVTQQPTQTSSNSAVQGAMAQEITVEGGNYYFKPNEIKVKKGDKVKITFKNAGGFHDFVLDEFKVKTEVIKGGTEATVEFTADKTGTFEYYCSVPMHRKMGMTGNLIVE